MLSGISKSQGQTCACKHWVEYQFIVTNWIYNTGKTTPYLPTDVPWYQCAGIAWARLSTDSCTSRLPALQHWTPTMNTGRQTHTHTQTLWQYNWRGWAGMYTLHTLDPCWIEAANWYVHILMIIYTICRFILFGLLFTDEPEFDICECDFLEKSQIVQS